MSSGRQQALLWGVVAVVLILAAPLIAAAVPAIPGCPLKTISGVPCPACGSGRAAIALSQGHFGEAFRWNPGASSFAVLFVVGGLAFGTAAARGIEPPGLVRELPVWARWGLLSLLVVNWIYVWRVAEL